MTDMQCHMSEVEPWNMYQAAKASKQVVPLLAGRGLQARRGAWRTFGAAAAGGASALTRRAMEAAIAIVLPRARGAAEV